MIHRVNFLSNPKFHIVIPAMFPKINFQLDFETGTQLVLQPSLSPQTAFIDNAHWIALRLSSSHWPVQ